MQKQKQKQKRALLVPQGALAIANVAAEEESRYAIDAVRVERCMDGSVRLSATDGRRLVVAEFDDSQSRAAHLGGPFGMKPGFTAIVDRKDWLSMSGILGKLPAGETPTSLPCLLIDEDVPPKAIRMIAQNHSIVAEHNSTQTDRHFPKVEDVIPEYECVDPVDGKCVTVAFDVDLLMGMLAAVQPVADRCEDGRTLATLDVPLTPGHPFVVRIGTKSDGGCKVTATQMPVAM